MPLLSEDQARTLGFSRQHISLANAASERSTRVFLIQPVFLLSVSFSLSLSLAPSFSIPPAHFTRALFMWGLYQLQRVAWIIWAAVKTSKWHMDAWHLNWSSIGTHRIASEVDAMVVSEGDRFYRKCCRNVEVEANEKEREEEEKERRGREREIVRG